MKLSELKDTDIICVCSKNNYDGNIMSVEDFKSDYDIYKEKEELKVCTTTEYNANLSAKDILDDAIEYESQNMYEDWNDSIWSYVTTKDIEDIQIVLDRILNRGSSSNIAYQSDELVEIDL